MPRFDYMRAWTLWRRRNEPAEPGRETGRRYRIAALCALLALGVAALDVLSPLGVAGGALYSVVIVDSMLAEEPRVVRYTAGLCAAFIVSGAFLSAESPVLPWIVVLNRAVFVVVVGVTAVLVLYQRREGATVSFATTGQDRRRSALHRPRARSTTRQKRAR